MGSQLQTAENLGNPLARSAPFEQSNIRIDQGETKTVF